ncbi:membrane protein [Desulfovibrio psychrotolerans]|uniref:Membrane protein n=1 Tax=Desulfovibrio psychrotolerans TaxID=415242 RepID=A0A7J0BWH6_9BACT|nr:membrane protein [Desulfovibrio psychrotolerans]
MTASDNTVTINGGTASSAFGGFAYLGGMAGPATATASGNSVTLNNGSLNNIGGGFVSSMYLPGTHSASGNTVTINGGSVFGDVYGGYVTAKYGRADAINNTVTISGGSVSGWVYGGWADGSTGQATGNTVTISGSPVLTNARLYGGAAGDGVTDAFSGNSLNVKTTGLTVKDVYNFQYLNFYLPSTVSAGDTVLTVTGTADLTGSSGRSSTVNVGIEGSSSPLQAGDTITLIDAGTLVTNSGLNSSASGTGMQGVTLKYNFDLTTESNKLLATVSAGTTPTVNEQSKALSEGFVSGMGAVMQGADVAAAQGMDSAVAAAKAGGAGGGGAPVGFGALSGGSVRHNTGSHVDMHSVSLMAGLSWGADTPSGRLTVGPFVEYGYGSYSTYNSFSNAASVEGDGNTRYLGGGILGRMDLANTGPGHIYVEASGRGGGLYNEYESSDLRNAAGRSAEYDSSSKYYGLHLGTGYVWNIAEDASLDLYAKYFWTRQEGDSVTLSTGDPIDFKDVDSSRLRLGSRVSYMVNEYLSPYIGAAYEREFDGTARASTNGYAMKAPSMGGDTGTGELGLVYTPSASVPVSFDLGVQNSVGKREGLTGSLQFKYEF